MNHMEKVAEMLGVKLGERFRVRDREYLIDRHGLNRYYPGCDMGFPDDALLSALIRGELNIKKLPWKPQKGDRYYVASIDSGILVNHCQGDFVDYAMYYAGNCFATEEEARAHAPEVIERLKKFYENGEYRRNEQ